ncbi:Conserved_hypothetical protein [Hexamita inflata]|uniref:GATA-type domain-containing protein n=1 Tax=Hexamita inflata TaxID=28002 RepID=A0AA86QZB2_9EUKA|nr:Conserved hypothetical protein [Hexamita inflata]
MNCDHCGADPSSFNKSDRDGQIICTGCGYVQSRIQDKGLSARVFKEAGTSQLRNTIGSQINKTASQQDRTKLAVNQICSYLQIDQSHGVEALQIYEEYQKKTSQFKTLRSRNTEVVMAACLYCQLELMEAVEGKMIKLNNPALDKYRVRLETYCEGKGRNTKTSAFDQQLKDIEKYVNFNAMRSVDTYVPEVKIMLDWPGWLGNNVIQLQKVFKDQENKYINEDKLLRVPTYTALLYFILTMQFEHNQKIYKGYQVQDQEKICDRFGMNVDFFRKEAMQLIAKKKGLVAQVFDKIEIDKKNE